jgi:hypothetical protein
MTDGKQDELDRALDAALAKYAAVEPREGLEDRVLANLRIERAQVAHRAWWRWSVAGALAAVVIVALALALRSGMTSHPDVANHLSSAAPSARVPATQVASNPNPAPTLRTRRPHPLVVTAGQAELRPPKLERFPSPQPLSEQEKLLQRYVEDYPEQAVLIARARSEALQQDQLEELKAFPPGDRATDSEQRNNGTTER